VDPVDRAAKQRIFSPEEPTKARGAAAQPVAADRLADDPALMERVFSMNSAEACERIGPFRYTAEAAFEWIRKEKTVRLRETRELKQATVSEFHLRTDNSRDYGLEYLSTQGRIFARSKYHRYREQKGNRYQAEMLRDDVFGGIRTIRSLLNKRLALQKNTTFSTVVAGRKAYNYVFVLDRKPNTTNAPTLPKIRYPEGGPDLQTRLGIAFAQKREPRSVEGELLVDEETGVPLRMELTARLEVPDSETKAELVVFWKSELTTKKAITLEPPPSYLPDEGRPNAIAAALRRFGNRQENPEQDASAEEADSDSQ
jgi:hypothetical protein